MHKHKQGYLKKSSHLEVSFKNAADTFPTIFGNKNWFPSSFEQILKLRILGSILADFPLENPPKKPYGTLGQSDFW